MHGSSLPQYVDQSDTSQEQENKAINFESDSQRSTAANDRAEPGHWEADLVICKRNRPLLVLHERKTRLTVMTRLASKTAAETITAITDILARLDPKLRRSMTFPSCLMNIPAPV